MMAQLKAIKLATNADESSEDESDHEVVTKSTTGKERDARDDVGDAPTTVDSTSTHLAPAQRLNAYLDKVRRDRRNQQVETDPTSCLTNGKTKTDMGPSNPCVLPDYVA